MDEELQETYHLTAKAAFVESPEQALVNLCNAIECINSVLGEILAGTIQDVDDRILALNMLEVSNGFAAAVEVYAEGAQS